MTIHKENSIQEISVVEKSFIKENPDKIFEKELIDLKGIGESTAKKILGIFPRKDRLKQAISAGIELPYSDKINELLKKYYS